MKTRTDSRRRQDGCSLRLCLLSYTGLPRSVLKRGICENSRFQSRGLSDSHNKLEQAISEHDMHTLLATVRQPQQAWASNFRRWHAYPFGNHPLDWNLELFGTGPRHNWIESTSCEMHVCVQTLLRLAPVWVRPGRVRSKVLAPYTSSW